MDYVPGIVETRGEGFVYVIGREMVLSNRRAYLYKVGAAKSDERLKDLRTGLIQFDLYRTYYYAQNKDNSIKNFLRAEAKIHAAVEEILNVPRIRFVNGERSEWFAPTNQTGFLKFIDQTVRQISPRAISAKSQRGPIPQPPQARNDLVRSIPQKEFDRRQRPERETDNGTKELWEGLLAGRTFKDEKMWPGDRGLLPVKVITGVEWRGNTFVAHYEPAPGQGEERRSPETVKRAGGFITLEEALEYFGRKNPNPNQRGVLRRSARFTRIR